MTSLLLLLQASSDVTSGTLLSRHSYANTVHVFLIIGGLGLQEHAQPKHVCGTLKVADPACGSFYASLNHSNRTTSGPPLCSGPSASDSFYPYASFKTLPCNRLAPVQGMQIWTRYFSCSRNSRRISKALRQK